MEPEEIQASDDPVEILRAQGEDYTANFPVVPNEVTNWIDEQRAVTESCALSNLSHHMTSLRVTGPDARAMLSHLSINDFEEFPVGKAKQVVMCNPNGHIMGDGPLLRLDENEYYGPGVLSANWVKYHQETGDYDVDVEIEPRTSALPGNPDKFVFQVQGPFALDILEPLTDTSLEDVPFYSFEEITLAGHDVIVLGHGMSLEPGFEFIGSFEHGDAVEEAILETGQEYGIKRLGSKAYHTLSVKLGWLPPGVPPIYDMDMMEGYRNWLDVDSREATYSIDGSFVSEDITDYYMSPIELGYGPLVTFDHEFIGRDALEAEMADPDQTLVSLKWTDDDVINVSASLYHAGENYKYMDLPRVGWGRANYDTVLKDGDFVGTSHSRAYQYDVRSMISLCRIDTEYAESGTEVTIVWGEKDDSPNPKVEDHVPTEITATVRPVPYTKDRRKSE